MGLHDGRHALVTGGGTGIGLAIARALAAEGARVTITGRRADVLDRAAATCDLYPLRMDVSDEASVRGGMATAVGRRGPIAICVANAGVAEPSSVKHLTLAEWRRTMAINLDGAFLPIREMLRGRTKDDWGRVIAISSVMGLRGIKGAPAYTTSKHAMIGLIRALAADHPGAPITFNALCPAYVDTDIVPQNVARIMERTGGTRAHAEAAMQGANPHGRLIDPAEIATAAMWLCAPGSESVNGQAIEIAGGQM